MSVAFGENCHVVELLAMTKGRAVLPFASLESVNNLCEKYILPGGLLLTENQELN